MQKQSIIRQEHYLHMQKHPLFNLIDDNFIGFPVKNLVVCVCKILLKDMKIIYQIKMAFNAKGHQVIAEEFICGWDKEYELYKRIS